jgi:hypothetical protein
MLGEQPKHSQPAVRALAISLHHRRDLPRIAFFNVP